MIKYNNSDINDWNFDDSNIIKVYHNGAVCYYKINVSSPTAQTPCFAVVVDISQYSDTEFEDVFNKADEKWYKLNNLNQYEQYGIYGSGRTITYYEGKLTIDGDYEYMYSGSSWVNVGEVSGSTATLPNVPFVLNYNAQNYDATTHTISMTRGQLNDTDAVAYNNPSNIVDHSADGYITISNSSMRIRKQGQDISLFNRTSNSTSSDLTIVCKAKSTSGENIITNRDGNYNWMYRLKTSGILTFHGVSETGSISWNTSNPDIMSVRTYYDSGTKLKYNNWTQNTSTTPTSFTYGSTNTDSSAAGALFVGYSWNYTSEQWSGDFYWVYMSQNTLTDEQIQQVITYNEGGGQTEYPIYYDEIQDPPDNVTFTSMTEAEDYQCPWVGMHATIAGDNYIFSGDSQSGYEWVYQPPRIPTAYTEVEYVENTGNSSVNLGVYLSSSVGNTFEITMTNTMSYTSGWGEYQTILTCMSEVGEPYGGFAYRFYNSESSKQCFLNPTTGQTFSSTTVDSKFNVVISCSGILNGYTHDYPLNLFSGLNSSKTPFRYCKGKVYSLQVTFNDVLTRDLVPCQRKSDSVYGLYDVVGGVFYTSITSTPLIGGQPV